LNTYGRKNLFELRPELDSALRRLGLQASSLIRQNVAVFRSKLERLISACKVLI